MVKKISFFVLLTFLLISCTYCFAGEISLSDAVILYDGVALSSGEALDGVLLSNQMDNGSSGAEAMAENIKIDNVITITKAGEYVFSGNLSNGQLAIDANKIDGEVKLILNGVNINCEDAPVIFVYSKDIKNEKCKVTISPAKDTENEVNGGRLKVDVLGFEKQDEIVYYVEKGYDDEDNSYFEKYKYDGAISSDISINFDGEGILNIGGNGKEGIESKMHITISNGTYVIKSVDDAINASADGESIITIDGGTVIAYLTEEAVEGDGIDSNGYIYINGGKVYAFACPGADSGIDSDKGTYINGGEVLSTGSMSDSLQVSEDIGSVRANFSSEIQEGEDICIADKEGNVIFALKTNRRISNLLYASHKLSKDVEYIVYTDVTVEGNLDEWSVYTDISSSDLTKATENEFNEMVRPGGGFIGDFPAENTAKNKVISIILFVIALTILIVVLTIDMKSENKNVKLRIINLVAGLVIGVLISFAMFLLIGNNTQYRGDFNREMMRPMDAENFEQMRGQNMGGRMNMPNNNI